MSEDKKCMPLIKVMLVDDDQLLLEDIQTLVDWGNLGFEIVGVFGNGQAAFDHLSSCRPDFIITDIRMPCMDGLAFVAEVKSCMPQVQMLLLTAYSDFDYAKEAIRLGVSDYVLKYDLNEAALTAELIKVRGRFFSSRSISVMSSRQKLEQFLTSPQDEEVKSQLVHMLESYGASVWGLMVIVPQIGLAVPGSTDTLSRINRECYRIRDCLTELSLTGREGRNEELGYLTILHKGRQIVVLVLLDEGHCSENRYRRTMYGLSCRFEECLGNGGEGKTTILYMPYGVSRPEQLFQAYECLDSLIPYTIFQGHGRIAEYEPVKARICEAELKLDEIEEIRQGMAGMTVHGIVEKLETLMERFCRRSYSLGGFAQLGSLMDAAVLQYRKNNFCSAKQIQQFRQDVAECKSAEEVWETFTEFSQHVVEFGCHVYSSRVRKAVQFIHENFGNDISVQDAADQLGFNAEYLNKLFKREVGQGFSRYLTAYRMEQAKNLLESGDYRVGEVAEMVGYKSSQYFSMTFRQIMGVPPSAFGRQGDSAK
ncbi:MAG: response regulator [Clostridiaceae bacterium]|nr:response regulator [Clostridiaceae bacterium]